MNSPFSFSLISHSIIVSIYNHFGLKRAFITTGAGLLKRVQPFSPAAYQI